MKVNINPNNYDKQRQQSLSGSDNKAPVRPQMSTNTSVNKQDQNNNIKSSIITNNISKNSLLSDNNSNNIEQYSNESSSVLPRMNHQDKKEVIHTKKSRKEFIGNRTHLSLGNAIKTNGLVWIVSWLLLVFVFTLMPSLMILIDLPGIFAYVVTIFTVIGLFFYYGKTFEHSLPALISLALIVVFYELFWIIDSRLVVLTVIIAGLSYLAGTYGWRYIKHLKERKNNIKQSDDNKINSSVPAVK